MVMEAEIHVYVLLFQQYGRKSFGFSVILSMLPLQNEKKAIFAREAVKISLEKKTSPMRITEQHWRCQEGVENVCVFFLFCFCAKGREEVMSHFPSRFNVAGFTSRAPAL